MSRQDPKLRWRRPAFMPALVAALAVGVVMIFANMTAIAAHDWRWFVVSGIAFLSFLGLTAYGLAANRSRERTEQRRKTPSPTQP